MHNVYSDIKKWSIRAAQLTVLMTFIGALYGSFNFLRMRAEGYIEDTSRHIARIEDVAIRNKLNDVDTRVQVIDGKIDIIIMLMKKGK